MRSDRRPRRSFVLIAVLVVVALAIFFVTALLFLVQAERTGDAARRDAARGRALARSGIERVLVSLDQQRDRILAGDRPRLDEQFVIDETNGRVGVVRLLPVTPGGERLAPEAAKLDVNDVTVEQLVATKLVEEEIATRIVAWRNAHRPVQSIASLLEVRGVTPELLYGPLDRIRPSRDARGETLGLGDRVGARLSDGASRGLADVLTVHAAEPALQRDGDRRIPLDVAWSSELERRFERQSADRTTAVVGDLLRNDVTDLDRAVRGLRNRGIEPAAWGEILDQITPTDGIAYGRLDVNAAPAAALQALPEINEDQAQQIVDARGALPADARAYPTWLVTESIVDAERYGALAGAVTTRSWTYRVRLAAGEIDPGDAEERIEAPVIYDVVIDLVDPRARIAYLRDVTDLELVALLADAASPSEDDDTQGEDRSARRSAGSSRG